MRIKGVVVVTTNNTEVIVYPKPYGFKVIDGPPLYVDSDDYVEVSDNEELKDAIAELTRRFNQ